MAADCPVMLKKSLPSSHDFLFTNAQNNESLQYSEKLNIQLDSMLLAYGRESRPASGRITFWTKYKSHFKRENAELLPFVKFNDTACIVHINSHDNTGWTTLYYLFQLPW